MTNKSVLDILKHLNRPYTYRELVLMLQGTKNQVAVCREIKRLMKLNQIIRVEIKIPKSKKIVLYKFNKNNTL